MHAFTLPPPPAAPAVRRSRAEIIADLCAREESRQRARAEATRAAAAKWAMELAALRKPIPPPILPQHAPPAPLLTPVVVSPDTNDSHAALSSKTGSLSIPQLLVKSFTHPIIDNDNETSSKYPAKSGAESTRQTVLEALVDPATQLVKESATASTEQSSLQPAFHIAADSVITEPAIGFTKEPVSHPVVDSTQKTSAESGEPTAESVVDSVDVPVFFSQKGFESGTEVTTAHSNGQTDPPPVISQAPYIAIPAGVRLPSAPSIISSASFSLSSRSSWGPISARSPLQAPFAVSNDSSASLVPENAFHERSTIVDNPPSSVMGQGDSDRLDSDISVTAMGRDALVEGKTEDIVLPNGSADTVGTGEANRSFAEHSFGSETYRVKQSFEGGIYKAEDSVVPPVLTDLATSQEPSSTEPEEHSTLKAFSEKIPDSDSTVGGVARPVLLDLPSKLGFLFSRNQERAKNKSRTITSAAVPVSEDGVVRPVLIDGLANMWAGFITLFMSGGQERRSSEDRNADAPKVSR